MLYNRCAHFEEPFQFIPEDVDENASLMLFQAKSAAYNLSRVSTHTGMTSTKLSILRKGVQYMYAFLTIAVISKDICK